MIKSITFAGLTLLATLTAVQAAMKSAVPDLAPTEAMLQAAGLPKAKMPPRRNAAAKEAAVSVEQIQLD